jgi:hypothetical protein
MVIKVRLGGVDPSYLLLSKKEIEKKKEFPND